MKLVFGILLYVFSAGLAGCNSAIDPTFAPSIDALKANETLVMTYKACHWGCTKGTIKFRDDEAIFENTRLALTDEEIDDLDNYFKLGNSPKEGWGCSFPIEISFELRRELRTICKFHLGR